MILEKVQQQLTTVLRDRVRSAFDHEVERVVLQVPPKLEMGDLATPLALELARRLKKAPRQIADAIVSGLELPEAVHSVTVEGAGYINFRLHRSRILGALLAAPNASPASASGEKVIVEHTNINPNKAAHIGHLRNAVLGDTLVRSLEWLGHHVETQNYIDDTGVQVADVVVGFQRVLNEGPEEVRARIERDEPSFDYFCWDLYSKMAGTYEANPEAMQWRRDTLHAIEHGEGETARLAAIVADAIVRKHVATAHRLGIEYDLLIKESDIIRMRFWDQAFTQLKESGAVILETEGKHAGCWVMKLSETKEFEGLEEPDKILVRSNGTVTYVGKDIAYQMWKFGLLARSFDYREFLTYGDGTILWESTTDADGDTRAPKFGGAQRVYNVIDTRQGYLQKVVKEGLRLLGHESQADRSIHFNYEMVALSPSTATALGMTVADADAGKAFVEMSGRKGLGVKADDLMNALEKKAADNVRTSAAAEGNSEDAEMLGRQIAIAALRYFMLKFGRNKVIAFDFDEALTFEGDSGPYLQYSTVRAENIFRKMSERAVTADIDPERFATEPFEIEDDLWEIARQSLETASVVRRAVESLELSMLTHHTLALAQKFNSFYHKYPILNEADERERAKRAACAQVFRNAMKEMFALTGIPLPARM